MSFILCMKCLGNACLLSKCIYCDYCSLHSMFIASKPTSVCWLSREKQQVDKWRYIIFNSLKLFNYSVSERSSIIMLEMFIAIDQTVYKAKLLQQNWIKADMFIDTDQIVHTTKTRQLINSQL
jgi:hypothetical protein